MSDRPVVRTVPNVELFTVGTFDASTGKVAWAPEHIASAIAAYDDPGYSTPVVKIGHTDPRFDGSPAFGRIVNPRASEDGMTLIADLVGVPTLLADLIDGQRSDPEGANAWPRRSIEGTFGLTTPSGRQHDFALTALALLGDTLPAVGTLADIAAVYGMDPTEVAASAAASLREDGHMPQTVAAAVDLDQVRQQFYMDEAAATRFGAYSWVRAVFTDHLIVDDDQGSLFRLPWSEGAGQTVDYDVENASRVVLEYQDAPEAVAAAAGDGTSSLTAGSLRAATAGRMRTSTTTPPDPAPVAASGSSEHVEDKVADANLAAVAQKLGVADDADEGTILAALDEALAERADPADKGDTGTPAVPDGFTLVDADTLSELRTAASRGVEAHTRLMLQDRDGTIKAAVSDGRIARASVARWTERWDKEAKASGGDAPDTRDLLAQLPKGLVPVEAAGNAGGTIVAADDEALYGSLFPDEVKG